MKSEFNPYSDRLSAQTAALNKATAEKLDWISQLAWYALFDSDASFSNLNLARTEEMRIACELAQSTALLKTQRANVSDLMTKASIGLDPRYWFSSQRAVAKRMSNEASQILVQLEHKCAELQHKKNIYIEQGKCLQTDLNRYRSFDSLRAKDAIRCLDSVQIQLNSEISNLTELTRDADVQLQPHLLMLNEKKRQRVDVLCQMDVAKKFDQSLSNAKNSYDRALIHDECTNELGDGSPKNILRSLQRTLDSIERDIRKLEERLTTIFKRLTREVRTVVIDGNNLCYQRSIFIGLAPLTALVMALSLKYEVIIVFDASARSLFKMKNAEIVAHFDKSVKVHVMPRGGKADEAILELAEKDPTIFVISNDKFTDFTDKRAVAEDRLFKHDIGDDVVCLHDLGLAIQYSSTQ